MSNQSKQVAESSVIVMDFLLALMAVEANPAQREKGLMVLDEAIKMAQVVERELFIADQKILARN